MDTLITILGMGLVLVAAIFVLLRQAIKESKAPPHRGEHQAAFVVGILGCAMIISPRITSLPTPFGAVQAAAKQALVDAGDIAALKTQAQTQTATINLVADEATKAKALSEAVAKQVTEAQDKLTALNAALSTAQSALDKTKQDEDFTMTVLAAQNDDRKSYDKLRAIAEDARSSFSSLATKAWLSVTRAHTSSFYNSGFTFPWNKNIDPAKLDLGQLTDGYRTIPSYLRPALLEYIENRKDISKQSRLDFFMKVITSDDSLTAEEYAGRYFIALSGQPTVSNPMNADGLSSWWKEHRKDFDGQ